MKKGLTFTKLEVYLYLHLCAGGLPDQGNAPKREGDVLCRAISIGMKQRVETQHINTGNTSMNTLSKIFVVWVHKCS